MKITRENGTTTAVITWQSENVPDMERAAAEAGRLAMDLLAYTIAYGSRCAACQATIWSGNFRWTGAMWEHRCPGVLPQAGYFEVTWEPNGPAAGTPQ